MHAPLQGWYREHIIKDDLPESLFTKSPDRKKSLDQEEEQWAKRQRKDSPDKSRLKYFQPHRQLPEPKKKGKKKPAGKAHHKKDESRDEATSLQDNEAEGQVTALWRRKNCEVVVAVVRSTDKKSSFFLHHSEFKILQPHKWLVGETIKWYFQATTKSCGHGTKIYILNHYSAQVILNGERSLVCKQSLPKVNFGNYNAVMSFLNVDQNHWKFIYLHEPSGQVFLIDPAGQKEKEESEHAALKFREYFQMRRSRHGKDDWVDIKWKGGEITPTMQQDTFSCGVFVMQIAKEVAQNVPNIPSRMDIEPSQKHMEQLRKEMAEDILKMSEFNKANNCFMCATDKEPGCGPKTGLNVLHAKGGSMCCA